MIGKQGERAAQRSSFAALLALPLVALSGCTARSASWDTPFELGDTVGLTGSVAMVDKSRSELMMLSTHGDDNQLSIERLPIGKNVVSTQTSRGRDKLFVLTSGEARRLNEGDEKPQLFVVSGGIQPKIEQSYTLTARLQKLALDPEGEWAVVHDAGGVVVNVNELILVNLADPGAAPISRTIHSTGGAPQRFTFTPLLTLPGGERRRLLVVETNQDVSVIDLSRPEANEITVPLARTNAGQLAQPVQIAFHDTLPGPQVASYLAVRLGNDASVLTLRLGAREDEETGETAVSLAPNLLDAGALPSTVEFVETDRGLRLAALVPSLQTAVLFDPTSSKSERVKFDHAYSGIARVTGLVTDAPANGDVALLYSNQVASIGFWRLGNASATPYASFDSYNVDTTVSSVLDVPGDTFGYLKLLVASNQSEFFVLDLKSLLSYPMHALDHFNLRLSPDGLRAWAFQPGDLQFAQLAFGENHHPSSFDVELPVADVFDIQRSGGGRSALVLHASQSDASDVGVTLFDAEQPDSADTRFVSELKLEGL